ncbi:uncharacterized protein LOC134854592 [Symsagittifera roscoffensis]|uniref:uncharacterized protein LOC134854592 n=1 Tax=Symsagittifera roscoffensis TaxID=84072 RepID=UPI00307B6937
MASDVGNLTDDQLRAELLSLNVTVGPIIATTRSLYEKKLLQLRSTTGVKSNLTCASSLSDDELKRRLSHFGVTVGPINEATRSVYQTKLKQLTANNQHTASNISAPQNQPAQVKSSRRCNSRLKTSSAQTDSYNTSDEEDEFQRSPCMDWEQAPIPLNPTGGFSFPMHGAKST